MKNSQHLRVAVACLVTIIAISFARIFLDTWAECMVDVFMTSSNSVWDAMVFTTLSTVALMLLVASMVYHEWCKAHPVPLGPGYWHR